MKIYVTSKYIKSDNSGLPHRVSFQYNGRCYEGIELEQEKWNPLQPKTTHKIRLRYCTYESWARLLLIISVNGLILSAIFGCAHIELFVQDSKIDIRKFKAKKQNKIDSF